MTRRLTSDSVPPPSADQPRPGDVLGGKYRIERELGSGGMGVVYEVTHLVMTKTRFAIKWLLPLANDADAARRFRREARISGAIRHPHVVEVYDVNIDDSGSYMVMELLEGESLAGRLSRTGSLPVAEACKIAIQCAAGVAAAHAAGVIHRDIKPANIFLCRDPLTNAVHPKVLDFGVSRVVAVAETNADTTHTRGTVVGTPAYMSPEQLRAADCDARTDVYALGVTLYEALAGQRAFNASSEVDLVVKIVTGAVPPLETLRRLPAGLSDVVMKAMHRSAEDRYATITELAQALAPFAEVAARDQEPSAAANDPSSQQPSAASKTRWAWWLAAVVIAAAAIFTLTARYTTRPEGAPLVRPAPPPSAATQTHGPAATELAAPAATHDPPGPGPTPDTLSKTQPPTSPGAAATPSRKAPATAPATARPARTTKPQPSPTNAPRGDQRQITPARPTSPALQDTQTPASSTSTSTSTQPPADPPAPVVPKRQDTRRPKPAPELRSL
ncbi:MAG: serine/threonine-protein kinase [Polyangiales bacterium]